MTKESEIVRALREMLPPKVDYASLVCAEGFAHGQHYVWEDPEPYIISDAADLIESLQAELAASQRRERAAVEDLIKIAEYSGSLTCHCNEMIKIAKAWRGPEAGKGEAE